MSQPLLCYTFQPRDEIAALGRTWHGCKEADVGLENGVIMLCDQDLFFDVSEPHKHI